MAYPQTIERKAERTTTKFTGQVTCKGGSSRGIVKDLSESGICFQLYFDINAKTGQEVSIESEEFGHLTGIVQWYRGDRIGIRLDTSSNTAAQISSYFKYFR
ncbi:PilZ domain-containing protein [Pararhizobium sp. BT-229]|uniref:PilZ domain-containing protein n=1 Tax=Pararhizobium sp. BT-229 TaxID=2986923 RepID=UPI0021F7A663|nr:PilZ domain-containing protein [Pararhizobium sp. BT-229]MCV9960529.1 PilZ domain-containing protein [Pararhizobium sp. BT-229]